MKSLHPCSSRPSIVYIRCCRASMTPTLLMLDQPVHLMPSVGLSPFRLWPMNRKETRCFQLRDAGCDHLQVRCTDQLIITQRRVTQKRLCFLTACRVISRICQNFQHNSSRIPTMYRIWSRSVGVEVVMFVKTV